MWPLASFFLPSQISKAVESGKGDNKKAYTGRERGKKDGGQRAGTKAHSGLGEKRKHAL